MKCRSSVNSIELVQHLSNARLNQLLTYLEKGMYLSRSRQRFSITMSFSIYFVITCIAPRDFGLRSLTYAKDGDELYWDYP